MLWGDSYKVETKNFTDRIDLIARKTSNYYVSLAYESFEKFLRSITARIIINNRKKAELVDKELGLSSYNSCLIHLQKRYKNNYDIVSLLSNLNDDLKTSFKKERGLRNFLKFYRVYTKCRNHIIHANDTVDVGLFKNPEPIDEKFAIRYFGAYKNKRGSKYIIDTRESYKEALPTIVSFAYHIISSFDSTFIK